MRTLIAALAGLMLASCQPAGPDAGTPEQIISQSQRLLRSHLHDPASARFLQVHVADPQTGTRPTVCGKVSGRNASGARTDFHRFFVRGGDVGIEPRRGGPEAKPYPGGARAWTSSYRRFCRAATGPARSTAA